MAHNPAYTKVFVDTANNIGLGVHEVARCLGRTTLDVGQLCGDVNASGVRVNVTNKWAKYKPVRKANMYAHAGDWWMADDGKCGLAFTTYEELTTFITQVRALSSSLLWGYAPPRGFATYREPYRLLDFDGYNHLASFQMPYLNEGIELTIVSHDATHASVYAVPQGVADSLVLSDVHPAGTVDDALSEYYFGIILLNVDSGETGKWCAATAATKIGSVSTDVWNGLTIYGLDESTSAAKAYSEFRAIPFFSSVTIDEATNQSSSNDPTGTFLSANDNVGVPMYVHINGKYDLEITHNCYWSSTDPYVRGTATIADTSGPLKDIPLTNVQISIVEKNDHSVEVNGYNYGSTTIYHGIDERAEGSISGIALYAPSGTGSGELDPSKEYVLCLYCDQLLSPVYSTQTIRIL